MVCTIAHPTHKVAKHSAKTCLCSPRILSELLVSLTHEDGAFWRQLSVKSVVYTTHRTLSLHMYTLPNRRTVHTLPQSPLQALHNFERTHTHDLHQNSTVYTSICSQPHMSSA